MRDYFLDGVSYGPIGQQLQDTGYDPGAYRPYIDEQGRRCVTVNVGLKFDEEKKRWVPKREKMSVKEALERGFDNPALSMTTNATTLRKDEWIALDAAVLRSSRQRLSAWNDLAAASTYRLDGMSKEILEHETMNDPGEAIVDMDGISEGRSDAPLFQLEGLPLPVTHSSFFYSQRKLNISRNTGASLSTLSAEAAGRRIAETIEKTTIGVQAGLLHGTTANYSRASQVYGYKTHPSRNTKTSMTTPTGANGATTVKEVLDMRELLYGDGFFGPYVLYHSTDWDVYMDQDYYAMTTSGAVAPTRTLRQRLQQTDDIVSVRRLDYMTPTLISGTFHMILVSLGNPQVARAVIGMPLRVIQWPTKGGLQLNFKAMTIMAPQIRADYAGNSGICYGTVT